MCSSRVVPDRKCSILCQNSAVLDKFASDSRIVRKKIRSEMVQNQDFMVRPKNRD